MTIRTKIVLGFAVILAIGFAYVFHWVSQDLEPQYRKLTEEPLVDLSRVLAATAAASVKEGQVDVPLFERMIQTVKNDQFTARVYDFTKSKVDIRIYLTDKAGTVLFDSDNRAVGEDYSKWNDVVKTLRGEYGARTSHNDPGVQSSVMYVAAPVILNRDIIGVLSVGKPTMQANVFVAEAERRILVGMVITVIALILVGGMLAKMLTGPIERLTTYARTVRDGQRIAIPALGSGEIAELGAAFDEMREALEGKKYVEQYVQTLTHEIKSPVSAIKGASELLLENPPESQRDRFLENIKVECQRIQGVIERMLLLARIEARQKLESSEPVAIMELFEEVQESFLPQITKKKVQFKLEGQRNVTVQGERFLLHHVFSNLIHNALEFCSEGGSISVQINSDPEGVKIVVLDDGTGIPEYALGRIFERFYSLKRPDSGKKSSGLGLSLVREVVELHGGRVAIKNISPHGTEVMVVLSLAH